MTRFTRRRTRGSFTRGILSALLLTLAIAVSASRAARSQPASSRDVTSGGHRDREGATAKGPIGWDVYRRLDRIAEIPEGADARQFSSFDRSGGNDDGGSGAHSCLRQTEEGCVIAEASGAGEIESIWFTRDGGDVRATGRLTIEVDGTAVVDAPLQDLVDGRLGPPFVFPLVENARQASGGVSVRVPIPFRTSMRITTEHNPRYYHVGYRVFEDSVGVPAFDASDQALDVIAMLMASGFGDPKPPIAGERSVSKSFRVAPRASVTIAELAGPGRITQLRLRLPSHPRDARLEIRFDGERTVDSPVGEFFGSGLGDARVRSLFLASDPEGDGWLTSWWPMPFRYHARVELTNRSDEPLEGIDARISWAPAPESGEQREPDAGFAHFHASSSEGETSAGRDWLILEAEGTGKLVGVSQTFRAGAPSGSYLEGDVRIYVDGSRTPQIHGTGTEDFYEAGYYFNRGSFSLATHGYTGAAAENGCSERRCGSAYRLLIGDAIPFASSVRAGIEHGARNASSALYGSTAFWYGRVGPSLAPVDLLDVGVRESEEAHAYSSGPSGAAEILTSVFEGEFDTTPVTEDLRRTTAEISFVLRTIQAGRSRAGGRGGGMVLRRMSDQAESHQAARVFVDGAEVGLWRQPLGNAAQRWLHDSFSIPARFLGDREIVAVRLAPLAGAPAWSAARYEAFVRGGPGTAGRGGDGGVPRVALPLRVSPNPFRDRATIAFDPGPAARRVELSIVTPEGRRVATIVDGAMMAGPHELSFDATGLPSGVYFYRLSVGLIHGSGRMVLVR